MTIDELDLLDWKRRIFELYAEIRRSNDPQAAWSRWCNTRDELFASHPQSPLPQGARSSFTGLRYFDYDPAFRVTGELRDARREKLEIDTSGSHPYEFSRCATVHLQLRGEPLTLDVYWLENYGGGLFLPFRDATAGDTTYGAGRYLLDTVKGADLGTTDSGELILDFNFAYNPSCAYDEQWVCPLAPPANRLPIPIEAGERHA